MPVPAQLWPESHRQLWRDSLYVLVVGWVCMHAVHLEEVCLFELSTAFFYPHLHPLPPRLARAHFAEGRSCPESEIL